MKNLLTLITALSLASAVHAGPLSLNITVHVENIGDQIGTEGSWVGTKGKGLRLEAFTINIADNNSHDIRLMYACHIQNKGDTLWLKEGEQCGTKGQGLRLEAFKVKIVGSDAGKYKLKYQCHVQEIGDTPWIDSPQLCGTKGSGYRLESLIIDTF